MVLNFVEKSTIASLLKLQSYFSTVDIYLFASKFGFAVESRKVIIDTIAEKYVMSYGYFRK